MKPIVNIRVRVNKITLWPEIFPFYYLQPFSFLIEQQKIRFFIKKTVNH